MLGGSSKRCPICGKPADVKCRPFCSKRCKIIDLGDWATEAYRIPGKKLTEGEMLDGEDRSTKSNDQSSKIKTNPKSKE